MDAYGLPPAAAPATAPEAAPAPPPQPAAAAAEPLPHHDLRDFPGAGQGHDADPAADIEPAVGRLAHGSPSAAADAKGPAAGGLTSQPEDYDLRNLPGSHGSDRVVEAAAGALTHGPEPGAPSATEGLGNQLGNEDLRNLPGADASDQVGVGASFEVDKDSSNLRMDFQTIPSPPPAADELNPAGFASVQPHDPSLPQTAQDQFQPQAPSQHPQDAHSSSFDQYVAHPSEQYSPSPQVSASMPMPMPVSASTSGRRGGRGRPRKEPPPSAAAAALAMAASSLGPPSIHVPLPNAPEQAHDGSSLPSPSPSGSQTYHPSTSAPTESENAATQGMSLSGVLPGAHTAAQPADGQQTDWSPVQSHTAALPPDVATVLQSIEQALQHCESDAERSRVLQRTLRARAVMGSHHPALTPAGVSHHLRLGHLPQPISPSATSAHTPPPREYTPVEAHLPSEGPAPVSVPAPTQAPPGPREHGDVPEPPPVPAASQDERRVSSSSVAAAAAAAAAAAVPEPNPPEQSLAPTSPSPLPSTSSSPASVPEAWMGHVMTGHREGAAACDRCRSQKLKCDKKMPCGRCARLKHHCTRNDVLMRRGPPTRLQREIFKHIGLEYRTFRDRLAEKREARLMALGIGADGHPLDLPRAQAQGQAQGEAQETESPSHTHSQEPIQGQNPVQNQSQGNPEGDGNGSDADQSARLAAVAAILAGGDRNGALRNRSGARFQLHVPAYVAAKHKSQAKKAGFPLGQGGHVPLPPMPGARPPLSLPSHQTGSALSQQGQAATTSSSSQHQYQHQDSATTAAAAAAVAAAAAFMPSSTHSYPFEVLDSDDLHAFVQGYAEAAAAQSQATPTQGAQEQGARTQAVQASSPSRTEEHGIENNQASNVSTGNSTDGPQATSTPTAGSASSDSPNPAPASTSAPLVPPTTQQLSQPSATHPSGAMQPEGVFNPDFYTTVADGADREAGEERLNGLIHDQTISAAPAGDIAEGENDTAARGSGAGTVASKSVPQGALGTSATPPNGGPGTGSAGTGSGNNLHRVYGRFPHPHPPRTMRLPHTAWARRGPALAQGQDTGAMSLADAVGATSRATSPATLGSSSGEPSTSTTNEAAIEALLLLRDHGHTGDSESVDPQPSSGTEHAEAQAGHRSASSEVPNAPAPPGTESPSTTHPPSHEATAASPEPTSLALAESTLAEGEPSATALDPAAHPSLDPPPQPPAEGEKGQHEWQDASTWTAGDSTTSLPPATSSVPAITSGPALEAPKGGPAPGAIPSNQESSGHVDLGQDVQNDRTTPETIDNEQPGSTTLPREELSSTSSKRTRIESTSENVESEGQSPKKRRHTSDE